MTQTIDKIFYANIPLAFLLLTILVAFIFKHNRMNKFCNLLFFFPIGLGGIWNFIIFFLHIYDRNSNSLFIVNHFFDTHVAIAYLSFGVSGIIASLSNLSYKFAVAVIITIFLFGMATDQFIIIRNMDNFFHKSLDFDVLYNILVPIFVWISLLINYISPVNDKKLINSY